MLRSTTLLGLVIMGLALACAEDPEVVREGGPLPGEPGEGGRDGNGDAEPVPFCAAFEVVAAKCQRCHGEPLQFGAPVPFLSVEDFHRPYGSSSTLEYWDVAIDQVESDQMPYVGVNEPPTSAMPPVESLTADEKATLLGWLKQGATAEGGTDCP